MAGSGIIIPGPGQDPKRIKNWFKAKKNTQNYSYDFIQIVYKKRNLFYLKFVSFFQVKIIYPVLQWQKNVQIMVHSSLTLTDLEVTVSKSNEIWHKSCNNQNVRSLLPFVKEHHGHKISVLRPYLFSLIDCDICFIISFNKIPTWMMLP